MSKIVVCDYIANNSSCAFLQAVGIRIFLDSSGSSEPSHLSSIVYDVYEQSALSDARVKVEVTAYVISHRLGLARTILKKCFNIYSVDILLNSIAFIALSENLYILAISWIWHGKRQTSLPLHQISLLPPKRRQSSCLWLTTPSLGQKLFGLSKLVVWQQPIPLVRATVSLGGDS